MSKETKQTQDGEEYVRFNQDIEGFWDGEGVVHFIPTGYKEFPSKKFRGKTSTIIQGRALSPVSCEDADGEKTTVDVGGLVGVWAKPGMRDLKNLYGCKVRMRVDGEKDIGQINPMKLFAIDIAKGSKPRPLPNLTPTANEVAKTPEPTNLDDLPF
jgi:hypothetical protein